MKITKQKQSKLINKFFFTAIIILIIIAVVIYLPTEIKSEKLKIGVSDDISGFVVDFMINNPDIEISNDLEPYFIKDC